MRHLLILFTLVLSQCKSFPLPAGQIVKYRVSSKYFNRPNNTSATTSLENSSSLYNLLSQIHYGGNKVTDEVPSTEQVTTIANELHLVSNDNKSNDDNDSDVTTVEAITNESPETITDANTMLDDVTSEQQEISTESINVDAEEELIEKVEKLSMESDFITTEGASSDEIMKHEQEEEIEVDSTSISPSDITTNVEHVGDESETAMIDEKIETNSNDEVSIVVDENQNNVPATLLSAVGDLLSSVLGISFSNLENDESEQMITDENLHTLATTEGDSDEHEEAIEEEQSVAAVESTVTSSNADETAAVDDEDQKLTSEIAPVINEVDLKIENLANVQTSFMTENTPEVYTERAVVETVKEQSDTTSVVKNESENYNEEDDDDDDKIVLETLSELTTIDDENDENENKPVSFEESVNHVMNLVRGSEGNLALEAAQNIVDSVLIDQHMDDSVSDLDQIVYGTLKEIETNLGLNEEDKNLPKDSFDPSDHEREEMIKNFETDINESLRRAKPSEDYESLDIEPNPAKAAIYYKFQYGEDF